MIKKNHLEPCDYYTYYCEALRHKNVFKNIKQKNLIKNFNLPVV